jgi:hypothetical protein
MMKVVSTLFVLILFVMGAHAQEQLGNVTVAMQNGSDVRCKLDSISAEKVYCFEIGSDKRVQRVEYDRDKVASITFGSNGAGKFQRDEEGYVLKNGKVIKGKVAGMKGYNFLVKMPNGNVNELPSKDVDYIQYPRSGDGGSSGDKFIKADVVLPANGYWRDSGIQVQKGDRMWFRVSRDQYIQCSMQYRRVDAEGAEPFWADNNRPVPDAKACALIGRVGNQGKPFRIGFNETPFVAQESGMIQIGINDPDLRDNAGQFNVSVYKQVQ